MALKLRIRSNANCLQIVIRLQSCCLYRRARFPVLPKTSAVLPEEAEERRTCGRETHSTGLKGKENENLQRVLPPIEANRINRVRRVDLS